MATTQPVAPEIVQMAEESFHRCEQEAFFHAFYDRLLGRDEAIRVKFARTDLAQQTKQLQHGLGLLFIYAKRGNPVLIDRIAARHGPSDVDAPPAMYPLFMDTLLATVKEFDAKCSPDVERAWRQALAPGLSYMCDYYTSHAAPQAPTT